MTSAGTGTPEFDLLCLMLRPSPDLVQARERIEAGIDFEMLLGLAGAHGVRPMLVMALSALSWEGVPDTVRASLRHFQQTHPARVLSYSEELCRVARLFEGAGIPFATFKGPALAAFLYGDISRREYNDIDIIVPAEHMAEAERLLVDLGYGNRQGDRAFRQAFLAHQRQYAFVRPEFDFAVDLHWHFCGMHLPFPVQPAEIWQSLSPVQIASCAVPSLSGVNLALMLAGHGTKESWRSLAWICDFARLIERDDDLDWSEVYRRARRQNCGDAILLGCAMTAGLLGIAIPAALSATVASNRRVRRLSQALMADLRQGLSAMSEINENLLDLELCERWFDRLKVVSSLAVTPTPGDYHALPLPARWWPAYYVTRPLRLAARTVARIWIR